MENQNQENTTTNKKSFSPMLIIAVVVIAAAGWMVWSSQTTPKEPVAMQQQPQPSTAQEPTVDASASAVKEIAVEGGMFYFKPNEIKVKKGEKVTITFNNTEGVHDFVIDEFNVKTEKIDAGAKTTVEFTPDKTGSFEFYCSVGSHRQMGMKGTLIVE